MLKINSKGQIAEGMLWLVRLLFIITPLILAIAFFVSGFVVSLDATPIEASVLEKRASNCFASEVGIIDALKFNSENLEKCYIFEDEGAIATKLVFADQEIEAKTSEFGYLEPLCGIKEGSNLHCTEFREYVLVNNANELVPGSLDMKIILKKN